MLKEVFVGTPLGNKKHWPHSDIGDMDVLEGLFERHELQKPDADLAFFLDGGNGGLIILMYYPVWLVVWNIFYILGISSSQLTFIFFRGVETTNQL